MSTLPTELPRSSTFLLFKLGVYSNYPSVVWGVCALWRRTGWYMYVGSYKSYLLLHLKQSSMILIEHQCLFCSIFPTALTLFQFICKQLHLIRFQTDYFVCCITLGVIWTISFSTAIVLLRRLHKSWVYHFRNIQSNVCAECCFSMQ